MDKNSQINFSSNTDNQRQLSTEDLKRKNVLKEDLELFKNYVPTKIIFQNKNIPLIPENWNVNFVFRDGDVRILKAFFKFHTFFELPNELPNAARQIKVEKIADDGSWLVLNLNYLNSDELFYSFEISNWTTLSDLKEILKDERSSIFYNLANFEKQIPSFIDLQFDQKNRQAVVPKHWNPDYVFNTQNKDGIILRLVLSEHAGLLAPRILGKIFSKTTIKNITEDRSAVLFETELRINDFAENYQFVIAGWQNEKMISSFNKKNRNYLYSQKKNHQVKKIELQKILVKLNEEIPQFIELIVNEKNQDKPSLVKHWVNSYIFDYRRDVFLLLKIFRIYKKEKIKFAFWNQIKISVRYRHPYDQYLVLSLIIDGKTLQISREIIISGWKFNNSLQLNQPDLPIISWMQNLASKPYSIVKTNADFNFNFLNNWKEGLEFTQSDSYFQDFQTLLLYAKKSIALDWLNENQFGCKILYFSLMKNLVVINLKHTDTNQKITSIICSFYIKEIKAQTLEFELPFSQKRSPDIQNNLQILLKALEKFKSSIPHIVVLKKDLFDFIPVLLKRWKSGYFFNSDLNDLIDLQKMLLNYANLTWPKIDPRLKVSCLIKEVVKDRKTAIFTIQFKFAEEIQEYDFIVTNWYTGSSVYDNTSQNKLTDQLEVERAYIRFRETVDSSIWLLPNQFVPSLDKKWFVPRILEQRELIIFMHILQKIGVITRIPFAKNVHFEICILKVSHDKNTFLSEVRFSKNDVLRTYRFKISGWKNLNNDANYQKIDSKKMSNKEIINWHYERFLAQVGDFIDLSEITQALPRIPENWVEDSQIDFEGPQSLKMLLEWHGGIVVVPSPLFNVKHNCRIKKVNTERTALVVEINIFLNDISENFDLEIVGWQQTNRIDNSQKILKTHKKFNLIALEEVNNDFLRFQNFIDKHIILKDNKEKPILPIAWTSNLILKNRDALFLQIILEQYSDILEFPAPYNGVNWQLEIIKINDNRDTIWIKVHFQKSNAQKSYVFKVANWSQETDLSITKVIQTKTQITDQDILNRYVNYFENFLGKEIAIHSYADGINIPPHWEKGYQLEHRDYQFLWHIILNDTNINNLPILSLKIKSEYSIQKIDFLNRTLRFKIDFSFNQNHKYFWFTITNLKINTNIEKSSVDLVLHPEKDNLELDRKTLQINKENFAKIFSKQLSFLSDNEIVPQLPSYWKQSNYRLNQPDILWLLKTLLNNRLIQSLPSSNSEIQYWFSVVKTNLQLTALTLEISFEKNQSVTSHVFQIENWTKPFLNHQVQKYSDLLIKNLRNNIVLNATLIEQKFFVPDHWRFLYQLKKSEKEKLLIVLKIFFKNSNNDNMQFLTGENVIWQIRKINFKTSELELEIVLAFFPVKPFIYQINIFNWLILKKEE